MKTATASVTKVTSSVPDEVRGGEAWVEYAIRYDAPEQYRGIVGNIRNSRQVAEGMAQQERRNVHVPGLRCTVVQRTVTAAEWVEAL